MTDGLYTPEPGQYVHGHHRDSDACRDAGEGLLRAGFAVREGVAAEHDCNETRHFGDGPGEEVLN